MVDNERVLLRHILGARGTGYCRPIHPERLRGGVGVPRRDCQGSRPRQVGGCGIRVLRLFFVGNCPLFTYCFFVSFFLFSVLLAFSLSLSLSLFLSLSLCLSLCLSLAVRCVRCARTEPHGGSSTILIACIPVINCWYHQPKRVPSQSNSIFRPQGLRSRCRG